MKYYDGECHKCHTDGTGYLLKKYGYKLICVSCYNIDKAKRGTEAKKREIIQLVQSRCKHRRMGVLSQEGHNILYCQDCNKPFYNKEI